MISMRYSLLLALLVCGGLFQGSAQINPIQNLEFDQGYNANHDPPNSYEMTWDEPESPHDSLIGYKIYRGNELFQFQTETYLRNWEIPAPMADPVAGGNGLGFLTEEGFWAHVTAIYDVNNTQIESTYTDSVETGGLMMGTKSFQKGEVKIYPNPTYGKINFPPRIQKVRVYNLQGKLIPLTLSTTSQVDFSPFSKGIYFIDMETYDGRHLQKKVVKK